MQRQNTQRFPVLPRPECGVFLSAQCTKFPAAALDYRARNLVLKRYGRGTRALRKRERVQVREGQCSDEFESAAMVVLRLAGESRNYVGADGGIRQALGDQFDAPAVMVRAIPAMHRAQNAIGGGLQRHVEVWRDAAGRSDKLDQILGDVHRLD